MHPSLKKILRALSLELRHTLEGYYDPQGIFHPGDLERRLNELGVWRERPARPLEELPHLAPEDKAARQVIDAYIAYRLEAEVPRSEAVAEFVRESAYSWANRLLALRCMEARGMIDEVILQKEAYGGRSLAHHRLSRRDPAACAGADEGLFAVLFAEFAAHAVELPELFNPHAPAVALRPSLSALKQCIALLSGAERAGSQEPASDQVFAAPDALGWAYQYWNAELKERIFETLRTDENAKIDGENIIPATQMYTDPYMVKFLVRNSLGAMWTSMHPESKLAEDWEYYVKDADRAPAEPNPVKEITFLDPAAGSGHFLLEAFDLFYQMYQEEGLLPSTKGSGTGDNRLSPEAIAASILNNNLFAIDIDGRAIQISIVALWMKAKEYAPDLHAGALTSFHEHLVATNIRLPHGKDHLKAFLSKHPDAAPLRPALETIFEGLQNVHELGSLVQIEEPVEKELRYLKELYDVSQGKPEQMVLFAEMKKPRQGELPLGLESYDQWKTRTLSALEDHFVEEAKAADPARVFFGNSAQKALDLFQILSSRFEIIGANPPWMGYRNMGAGLKQFVYWFNEAIINLFNGSSIQSICELANRTKTGDNEKFTRFIWEIQAEIGEESGWLIYQKGGEYKTYYGNNITVVKWSSYYKKHYRRDPNCRITDDKFTCKEVLTYNGMGQQFSGRITPAICTYDVAGPALVGSRSNLLLAAAVLNTSFASFLLKSLNTTLSFQSSDVLSIPIIFEENYVRQIVTLASEALELRKKITSSDILEYSFERVLSVEDRLNLEENFLRKKAEIEKLVSHLLVPGDFEFTYDLPPETDYERILLGDKQLKPELEISYYQNILSCIVLRLLGYLWPRQIVAHEPVPAWADIDGVIPHTLAFGEHTLFERVRDRIINESSVGSIASIEREFEEIVGEPLEKWLSASFFKRHISQFKRRPIAWQLSSRTPERSTANGKKKKGLSKAPAFSCLVYYHKLDADLLPKLRKQYVGPLRQRYETELRTLDGIAFLTADQSERRIQLQAWIDELRDFDARLESVAQGGFASPGLEKLLSAEPLDAWTSRDGRALSPETREAFLLQEQRYDPDLNDGVRVNIAPLQKAGLLAADVLDAKDLEKAIADRAVWRADERRWCREGKLPRPGWWK